MREEHPATTQLRFTGPVRSGPRAPFRPRFARSRNLQHQQFGAVYEREPETKTMGLGHFTGGIIYHHDTSQAGRYE